MKRSFFLLLFILILLTGCMENKEESLVENPIQAASSMKFFADLEEPFHGYKDFKQLFDEHRSEAFIREKYELVQQIGTDGASISTLALVEFQAGSKLLVQFTHDSDTDEYYIHDVVEVPQEAAAFLEKELD